MVPGARLRNLLLLGWALATLVGTGVAVCALMALHTADRAVLHHREALIMGAILWHDEHRRENPGALHLVGFRAGPPVPRGSIEGLVVHPFEPSYVYAEQDAACSALNVLASSYNSLTLWQACNLVIEKGELSPRVAFVFRWNSLPDIAGAVKAGELGSEELQQIAGIRAMVGDPQSPAWERYLAGFAR